MTKEEVREIIREMLSEELSIEIYITSESVRVSLRFEGIEVSRDVDTFSGEWG